MWVECTASDQEGTPQVWSYTVLGPVPAQTSNTIPANSLDLQTHAMGLRDKCGGDGVHRAAVTHVPSVGSCD